MLTGSYTQLLEKHLGTQRRLVVAACGPQNLVFAAQEAAQRARAAFASDGVRVDFCGAESSW